MLEEQLRGVKSSGRPLLDSLIPLSLSLSLFNFVNWCTYCGKKDSIYSESLYKNSLKVGEIL